MTVVALDRGSGQTSAAGHLGQREHIAAGILKRTITSPQYCLPGGPRYPLDWIGNAGSTR